MSLDPNKTYLVWSGTEFPNSENATFKAPAGSSIDWGDGTVETFDTASTTVNTHTYTDGKTEHTIAISGLTSIDNDAFLGCSNLTSVVIGDNVTSIGSYAFYNCSSLTSVTIGNGVTSIGYSAFKYCSNLNSISVDENNQSYKSIDGNLYTKDGATLIQYAIGKTATSFVIPDGVTNIGDWVFSDCSSLIGVTIPNSVTIIGNSAFNSCSSLTSIIIPDGVTSICYWAFSNCSSLTSVTIGNSVTSIGSSAFWGCSNLKQLILLPSTPPTLGSSAIPSTISKIYVPKSSKSAYQAETNWTAFASKIVWDNIYLSFVRFNRKNKEYINWKVNELSTKVAPILSDYVDDTLLGG